MFFDVYTELCQKAGKKPSAVAEELGINKSNVTNWKNNGYTPRGDALQKIAAYFGCTVDYLLEKEPEVQKNPAPPTEERDSSKVPDGYFKLNKENRAAIDRLIEQLASGQSQP